MKTSPLEKFLGLHMVIFFCDFFVSFVVVVCLFRVFCLFWFSFLILFFSVRALSLCIFPGDWD